MKSSPEKVVRIQKTHCIGCTKCVPVCPTNAIIGAPKQLHTVIAPLCIGCGLCITPCPTDCIEWDSLPALNSMGRRQKAQLAKHQVRQKKQQQAKTAARAADTQSVAQSDIQNTLAAILDGVS